MVRLGGHALRPMLPLLKRPPRVPDPGQHVDLLTEDGSQREGFRTLSGALAARRWREVVISVGTEDEYKDADREGRSAVGVPWPAGRMRVCSRLPWRLSRG